MDRTERFYRIDCLLRNRRAVGLQQLVEELEVSRATIKRDLAYLRDRYNAPIVWDRELRGYRLDAADPSGPRYELPGLWFSSREAHALLTFYHFLETVGPGLLADHVEPLKERLRALLESRDQTLDEIARRVRILPQAARTAEPKHFQIVAQALLDRRRLRFRYRGRARDEVTERCVSPQRLVHYRDNWYLDAWDHGKRALRTFSVDRIRTPVLMNGAAKNIPEARLDRHFAEGYGIFAGRPRRRAVLRFSPERARWVAEERWHPRQKGRFEGRHYILEIPYSDDRELTLDIMRYGADVEVLRPRSLRDKILKEHLRAAAQYRRPARK